MNFNQRIACINRGLTKAAAKRTALLAKIPVLKQEVKVLTKASEAAEKVFLKIENCCGPEWELILTAAEDIVIEINGDLDRAELTLGDAYEDIRGIEYHVETASYDVIDAATFQLHS